MSESHDFDVADGLAQMLADAGIGAYRPDGSAFQPGEVAIVLGEPPDDPAQAIGITPYPVSDNPAGTDGILAVQFMFRAPGLDPVPVWLMRDAVFDLIDGRMNFTVNERPVSSIWRQISAPQGRDELGRPEWADSYYLNVNRPMTAYRTD